MSSYLDKLETIIVNELEKFAPEIDRDARFPRPVIESLGKAGLLGLVSSKQVGGLGLAEASAVISRIAHTCPSTAMVVCMHYCATSIIEVHGDISVRKEIAAGRHLSTLAFSEAESRSHFWAPHGTATADGDTVVLNARKSWSTSAFEADSYVWSSKPVAADGLSTLWLVDTRAPGLKRVTVYDGLGLRGNASAPILADNVRIPASQRLGNDGEGFDVMMGVVLPWFNILSASCSVGTTDSTLARAIAHVTATRHQHLDASLADLPTIRAYLAKARVKADMAAALLKDTIDAVQSGRTDATARVLAVKPAAGETALEVSDIAMRVCGGAAFRKEVGVERLFRDARAAHVMSPTSDLLYDFLGKAITGLPLF